LEWTIEETMVLAVLKSR